MIYHTLLTTSVLASLTVSPAWAHDVQVSDDVGATLHIEPNDIARAGAPTEVWFALTQAGGTIIPLEDCDCRLTLYDSKDTAVATPALTPVSAEGFNNIPGATVTFPEVGAYELRLAGAPKNGPQFTPFELSFEVTVASRVQGSETAPSSPSSTESRTTSAPDAVTAIPEDSANGSEKTDERSEIETDEPTETSTPVSASNPWTSAVVWGGAVLAIGIIWGIFSGTRSPGGKQ